MNRNKLPAYLSGIQILQLRPGKLGASPSASGLLVAGGSEHQQSTEERLSVCWLRTDLEAESESCLLLLRRYSIVSVAGRLAEVGPGWKQEALTYSG